VKHQTADRRDAAGMYLREDRKPARVTWSPDPIVDQVSRKIRAAIESGASIHVATVY